MLCSYALTIKMNNFYCLCPEGFKKSPVNKFMQNSWQQEQQLLLQRRREGGEVGRREGSSFLPGSNPIITLPYALGQGESGRYVQQGRLERDLPTTVENAPLEGLGVEHDIWHSDKMEYFPFVPLKPSLWSSVSQNVFHGTLFCCMLIEGT